MQSSMDTRSIRIAAVDKLQQTNPLNEEDSYYET